MKNKQSKTDPESTRRTVREAYARIAGDKGKSCCSASPAALAKALGYKSEELGELPEGANMGLSCGNPTALATLKPGEVVLDLGSGGGFDVFIAAEKVGPSGRAIGVDMTAEMIEKARRNAVAFRKQTGLANVEFRLGEIEHIPAPDKSVDVVISNCVINLSPDKPQVWREIFRILKPGGRVAVSDLALLRPLPAALRRSVDALVGCVAGAVLKEETEAMARQAGFADVTLREKRGVIESMTGWNDPLYDALVELLPAGKKLSDYATSLDISAVKPKRA